MGTEKTVIAKLTIAEHRRLKRVCLAMNPPAKLKDFVRDLVLAAIRKAA